jgi:apolipoprotein N-acyltransferase
VAAVATFFAYPPFHLAAPSFVCLAPLVVLTRRHLAGELAAARLFGCGVGYGFLANALVLHWLAIALWRFEPWAVLWFGPILLGLGLVTGLGFLAAGWIGRRTRVGLWLALPTFLIAGELVVAGLGPFGFPWLGLGTSLSGWPVAVQLAELVGARGVGWLLVLANVAAADAWLAGAGSGARRIRLAALAAGGVGCLAYGWLRMATLASRPVGTVAVVQPNVGFREKWDPRRQDGQILALVAASADIAGSGRADLIVWPETAVPAMPRTRPDWESTILAGATAGGVPILAGGLADGLVDGRRRTFNAALWFQPGAGRGRPIYRKRHLVPLVELDPRKPGAGAFGGFTPGSSGGVHPSPLGRIAVSICFEGAFPNVAADDKRRGAEVIVNLANDAWLGPTSGPAQNAAHLVMRAIETRMGVVRAANTGPSLIIDPAGRVTARTRFGERATLVGVVRTAVRRGGWS